MDRFFEFVSRAYQATKQALPKALFALAVGCAAGLSVGLMIDPILTSIGQTAVGFAPQVTAVFFGLAGGITTLYQETIMNSLRGRSSDATTNQECRKQCESRRVIEPSQGAAVIAGASHAIDDTPSHTVHDVEALEALTSELPAHRTLH